MKRIISALIISALLSALIFTFSACGNGSTGWKVRAAAENLYSDDGYIDYANEVYFDTDTYPDMAEMGMFWASWDDSTDEIILKPADSAEGAAFVDPAKPTIINIHGVLVDGYYKQEAFELNHDIAIPSEFGLDTDYVSMLYLWLREGWNVGVFHYNRFASEGAAVANIESKIWATDGTAGVRYQHQDGSFSDGNITEYSLAEHFAAEYIRAMNLLPDNMGEAEIRMAAHSMGGQITTAGLFLLTELADYGQLPVGQLPDRFAMLDPYFSVNIENTVSHTYMGPKDITIHWSGKPLYENNTGLTMLECIKDLVANGMAVEYYTYDASALKLGMYPLVEEYKSLCTYTVVYPNYSGGNYNIVSNGHNGVREWYLCSIYSDEVADATSTAAAGTFAPSASMTTEEIKALKGKEYHILAGDTTVNASDDTMVEAHSVYFVWAENNYVMQVTEYNESMDSVAFMKSPSKAGYTFSGWYENPECTGTPVTSISPAAGRDYKLYFKFIANS